jgi:hypothetical protein
MAADLAGRHADPAGFRSLGIACAGTVPLQRHRERALCPEGIRMADAGLTWVC